MNILKKLYPTYCRTTSPIVYFAPNPPYSEYKAHGMVMWVDYINKMQYMLYDGQCTPYPGDWARGCALDLGWREISLLYE
jgi:hypothetical protein